MANTDNVKLIRIAVELQREAKICNGAFKVRACVKSPRNAEWYSSPLQQLYPACLYLIRAVGEFSAQNENSREISHHHRTANFSISRNYAWADVSIWVVSMVFFFAFFPSQIIGIITFWLNKKDSVLHCLLLFLLSIKDKLNEQNINKKGLQWNNDCLTSHLQLSASSSWSWIRLTANIINLCYLLQVMITYTLTPKLDTRDMRFVEHIIHCV